MSVVRTAGMTVPLLAALALVAQAAAPPAAPVVPPPPSGTAEPAHRPLTTADVISTSAATDWRPLDPQNTLYLELPTGRVIIELNTDFAPHHAANIEALTREGFYNGTAIVRSQDN